MTPTLRRAALMTLAMALFACADALIKVLGGAFSAAQIIWTTGLGGALSFAAWFLIGGQGVLSRIYLRPRVLLRSVFEAGGGLLFVSALVQAPLSVVSSIAQAAPLLVALGARVFLGMPIGPRRWGAILAGFAGVLLILRPGSAAVDAAAWLALGGVVGLAGRDLITRGMPPEATGARLSFHAFAALVIAGGALQAVQGVAVVRPDAGQALVLAAAIACVMGAYLATVAATRAGDIALVSSFRYTRLLFALLLATVFFGERPDAWTLIGAAVVIASGLYTLWRESRASLA